MSESHTRTWDVPIGKKDPRRQQLQAAYDAVLVERTRRKKT